jgi:N6-L-threonylcarbamoyladenine synthase
MLCLSIETSCDETSLAIMYNPLDRNKNFFESLNQTIVLNQLISTQIDTHKVYGGVIPEIGARLHANSIHFLLAHLLRGTKDYIENNPDKAQEINPNLQNRDSKDLLQYLDKIFVTTHPGLPSALRVGLEMAKTVQFFVKLHYNQEIELVPINHLQGHVASCFYRNF